MPDIAVELLARRNPKVAMLRPELGRTRLVDSSKARTQLGWHPAPPNRRSSTPPPRSAPNHDRASVSGVHTIAGRLAALHHSRGAPGQDVRRTGQPGPPKVRPGGGSAGWPAAELPGDTDGTG